MRCRELATSPHISFPAFGLLATLGCTISFADCTGSSLQQAAKLSLFPCSCAANSIWRRTRSLRQTPLIQRLPRRRGQLSQHRLLPDDRPAISPVLAAAAFAQHISYGPVMYENLLLLQTAEPQSYRCLSASKLGEAMVLCAGNFVAFRSLV